MCGLLVDFIDGMCCCDCDGFVYWVVFIVVLC